jgi:hypothetical protein
MAESFRTPELAEVIRASQVVLHPERFAYLQVEARPPGAPFLIVEDRDEVTVVVREDDVDGTPYLAREGWYRLLEVRVAQPFTAVGFLASITDAIAARGLNVLVVSTFSKDYLLVRDASVQSAIEALRGLGFPVTTPVE